jgi:hypothetical protein
MMVVIAIAAGTNNALCHRLDEQQYLKSVNSDSATALSLVLSSLSFSFFNHWCQTSGVDPAGY